MTRWRTELPLFAIGIVLLALGGVEGQGPARPMSTRFDAGKQSFQERRFVEAMGAFLDVLEDDPGNLEARRYQAAALQALVSERETQIRLESMELMRLSLHEHEKDEVVWSLCREAAAKMDSGDLLAASALLYKAGDLMPGHPEARRGLARAHGLVDLQVGLNQRPDGTSGNLLMRDALGGLAKLAGGDAKEAVELFQRALFLSSPGEEIDLQLQEFLRRARVVAGGGPAPVLPAPAAPPPLPAPSAPAPARVFGPPSPQPGWIPPQSPPAATERVAPPAPVIPEMPNQAKAAEAYIRGVTAYMSGRNDEARAAMRESLRLYPGYERAKKMLDRIDKEAKTK